MKIHIVGAGPTGMSVAWEILRGTKGNEVVLYDKKESAGGSWWEPKGERDLHATRNTFDNAFVNTHSIFKEMGIKWNDIFEKRENDAYGFVFKYINLLQLTWLYLKVLAMPERYRNVSIKDVAPGLNGELISCLTRSIDGVDWDVMTAYEFVKSFDHVALSRMYTQKTSGRVMCDAMQKALESQGATFVFGVEMLSLEHDDTGFVAKFSNNTDISGELLIICLDHTHAAKFLGTNWGPKALEKLVPSTYECINVLLEYDHEVTVKDGYTIQYKTPWNIIPEMLADKKTISCVLLNPREDILKTPPGILETVVYEQLKPFGFPEPKHKRVCWGAKWENNRWHLDQSSGVLSKNGQLPFFGKSKSVAMCGMMSPRNTPYASIEAATEVGRQFCSEKFGTRPPLTPFLLTHLFIILIVILLLYFNEVYM